MYYYRYCKRSKHRISGSPEKGPLHYLGVKKIMKGQERSRSEFVGQTGMSWAREGQVGKACSGYHRGME